MILRVERHPDGPRLFIGRWRSEHWKAGLGLIAWGVRWIWIDRRDFKAWLARDAR